MDVMHTAIEYLKGVGPERSRLFKEELHIQTYQDLLHFFPNRYIDRSKFYPINQLPNTSSEFQINLYGFGAING
jgi:ATP-dependent DNA helicase RecG